VYGEATRRVKRGANRGPGHTKGESRRVQGTTESVSVLVGAEVN
jgi:hypothetical protein